MWYWYTLIESLSNQELLKNHENNKYWGLTPNNTVLGWILDPSRAVSGKIY